MTTSTLIVENIQTLRNAHSKLLSHNKLTSRERNVLCNLLSGLPASEQLLKMKLPLNERLEFKLIDIQDIWPHLTKWMSAFNNLSRETNASWIDADVDYDLFLRNVIITVSFIPSYAYSKMNNGKYMHLHLITDGSAKFEFMNFQDAALFSELYYFSGSWKEAYLLVIKTLRQGWPQTKFPEEWEQLQNKK